ncbi:hypothetical protein VTK56DRAFT_7568 [Thermocarpiscus australiensis]
MLRVQKPDLADRVLIVQFRSCLGHILRLRLQHPSSYIGACMETAAGSFRNAGDLGCGLPPILELLQQRPFPQPLDPTSTVCSCCATTAGMVAVRLLSSYHRPGHSQI